MKMVVKAFLRINGLLEICLSSTDAIDQPEVVETFDSWHQEQHVHASIIRSPESVCGVRWDQQEVTAIDPCYTVAYKNVHPTVDNEEHFWRSSMVVR